MAHQGVLQVTPPTAAAVGSVRLDGGKHAFAHTLACAALADEGLLREVPDHLDARALRAGLELVFDRVEYDPAARTLGFGEPRQDAVVSVSPELAATSRSLFGLYPALLVRAREVRVAAPPQGCAIGPRPSTWYINTLRAFGVRAEESGGTLRLWWPHRRPADVRFDYPTMTGTVVALAAAAAAPGRSTISHRSVEPSCDDQIDTLAAMGARLTLDGGRVTVDSPGRFASVKRTLTPDRIHAVTYLTAGLLVRGRVTVCGSSPLRIPRFVAFLRSTGCRVADEGTRLTAQLPASGVLAPTRLTVGSEPHFSSDWAPMATLLLALRADGPSEIVDDVFPERLQFVDALHPHGLPPTRLEKVVTAAGRDGVRARVEGRPHTVLRAGTYATVPDIRGSVAIALAALTADGPTRVVDDFHIRRGYTDLAGDLRALGLSVTRSEA